MKNEKLGPATAARKLASELADEVALTGDLSGCPTEKSLKKMQQEATNEGKLHPDRVCH